MGKFCYAHQVKLTFRMFLNVLFAIDRVTNDQGNSKRRGRGGSVAVGGHMANQSQEPCSDRRKMSLFEGGR